MFVVAHGWFFVSAFDRLCNGLRPVLRECLVLTFFFLQFFLRLVPCDPVQNYVRVLYHYTMYFILTCRSTRIPGTDFFFVLILEPLVPDPIVQMYVHLKLAI